MKSNHPWRRVLTALLFIIAATAHAGLTQLGISHYTDYTGTIHYSQSGAPASATVYPTAINARQIGGDALPVAYGDSFTAFCVDIGNILHNEFYWESGPLSAATGSSVPYQNDGIFRQQACTRRTQAR